MLCLTLRFDPGEPSARPGTRHCNDAPMVQAGWQIPDAQSLYQRRGDEVRVLGPQV